jgi:hypothetical protein
MNRDIIAVLAFLGIIKRPIGPSNGSINDDSEEQDPIESSRNRTATTTATATATTTATSSYPKINGSVLPIDPMIKSFNEFLLKIFSYNGNDRKLVWKYEEETVQLYLERIRKIFVNNDYILDTEGSKVDVSYMTFDRYTSYEMHIDKTSLYEKSLNKYFTISSPSSKSKYSVFALRVFNQSFNKDLVNDFTDRFTGFTLSTHSALYRFYIREDITYKFMNPLS